MFALMGKKIILDVHTHTVASGRVYSSLQEMTIAAVDKGLQVLDIAEYVPSILEHVIWCISEIYL